jgi:antitoxin component of MazEF toxin-antitoxin module
MTKTITKVGNSQGIIFDAALMELAHLKVGDELNVELHQGGTITLTPIRPTIEPTEAAATAKRLIRKNAKLFRRLS